MRFLLIPENNSYSRITKCLSVTEGLLASSLSLQGSVGVRDPRQRNHEKRVIKYGREDLLPKCIRVETMEEGDRLKEARKRIKELEAALADAHIDNCLEDAFLRYEQHLGKSFLEEFAVLRDQVSVVVGMLVSAEDIVHHNSLTH